MTWSALPLHFIRARSDPLRFELSALNESAVIIVAHGVTVALPLASIFGFPTLLVYAVIVFVAFSTRRVLVVTPRDALFEHRVLGFVVRRRHLGLAPTVANLGFDWSELSIVPRDPALRRGLQDDERAVLLEWNGPDDVGASFVALATDEIARLHARDLAQCDYRTNALLR